MKSAALYAEASTPPSSIRSSNSKAASLSVLPRTRVLVSGVHRRDPAEAGAAEHESLIAARVRVRVDAREVDPVARGATGALEGRDAAVGPEDVAGAGREVGHGVEVEEVVAEAAEQAVGP